MCAGAIVNSRIRSVYFGAFDARFGAASTIINLTSWNKLNHKSMTIGGIKEKECAALLVDYFKKVREEKNEKKGTREDFEKSTFDGSNTYLLDINNEPKDKSKKQLRQEYDRAFAIVRWHINEMDYMGLLEFGAPQNEYDMEVAPIVATSMRAKNSDEITEKIINVFYEMFGEKIERKKAQAVAVKIYKDLNA